MNRKGKIFLNLFYITIFLVIFLIVFTIYNNQYDFYLEKEEMTLPLSVNYELSITSRNYEYSSIYNYIIETDSDILRIENGIITPLEPGEATILVKSKKGFHTKKIKVYVDSFVISSIEIAEAYIELMENDTYKIQPIINGNNNISYNLDYEVIDKNILEVDKYGNIKALKEGNTKVKISAGDISTYLNVNVIGEVKVNDIIVDKTNIVLDKGQTIKINVDVLPTNANNRNLYYVSSNENVATIKDNIITAISPGDCTVSIYSSNGIRKNITVKVNGNVLNDDVQILLSLNDTMMYAGETKKISATVTPSKYNVEWKSSNESVASIKDGNITALKEGTAIITATANNKSASVVITVKQRIIEATNIKLTCVNDIFVGYSKNLSYAISPSNVTDKNVEWISSNEAVLKVNSNGKITGIKPGNASISVKTKNNITSTCNILVKEKIIYPTNITLNTYNETITVGSTLNLSHTISPSNATDKSVEWTSSDESIASVSSSGMVTTYKKGKVRIKAKTSNGKEAICNIKVLEKESTKYSVPTIKYISGSNTHSWKNNYKLEVSSSDNVEYIELDIDGNGIADDKIKTSNNSIIYIPANNTDTCKLRFRSYNNGNFSDWTSFQHIHMDTEVPSITTVDTGSYIKGTWTVGIVNRTFKASDNIGIEHYEWSSDCSNKTGNQPQGEAITWAGINVACYRAVDYAGNVGPWSEKIVIKVQEGALFFGDSIQAGVSSNPYYGFAEAINSRYGLKIKNNGNPGWFISNALNRDYIKTTVDREDYLTPEYVILQGGVNDMNTYSLVPNAESLFKYGNNNDGLCAYLDSVIKKFPNSKIGYIITYKTFLKYDMYGNIIDLNTQRKWYGYIKEELNKRNIAYLDLFDGIGCLNGVCKTYDDIIGVNIANKTVVTEWNDNLHITRSGYDTLAPYVYNWMKSLNRYS